MMFVFVRNTEHMRCVDAEAIESATMTASVAVAEGFCTSSVSAERMCF